MLLDTCALLWLAHDRTQISNKTLEKIDESAVVFICAVSGFEIGLKVNAGKLQLPVPSREWINGILKHHHIDVIDLDLEICIKATALPPIHKDPCDRFIIAAALTREMPVVTADLRFAEYGVKVLI
ncbi:MAG: type II toxin-antitoxin system VapC family toxin [Deltaproteobacteria bacterium]|nr:type II toxin-antitoxin system VapC family toxin [Deltaproteobacteria bacterium]